MIGLTQTTGYAITALGFMHECGDRLVLAKEITQRTGIPLPYLSKILHALSQTGLIIAKRGYQGGFALSRSADEISLCDVAEAVEGQNWLPRCPMGIVGCTKQPLCPIHDFWIVQRAKIEEEMRRITLADISAYIKEKFLSKVKARRSPRLSELSTGMQDPSSHNGQLTTRKAPRRLARKAQP